MPWSNRLFLWMGIMAFLMILVSGCSAHDDRAIVSPQPTEKGGIGDMSSGEKPSGQQTEQEDVDGPGGMTPIGPKGDLLFDIYNLPLDWPRAVPLMTDFKVMIYQWYDDEMYVAGYGNVSMSRASNFYTNAQKILVSSNIWEQDPQNPSVTEGPEQVFFYIGKGNTLSVALFESGDNGLYFELYFRPATKE